MDYEWKRKDFSANSKIKETLLERMLEYSRERVMEIDEEYEDMIAAAGISSEEQKLLEGLEKKENRNRKL